jgi:hypothetical protein
MDINLAIYPPGTNTQQGFWKPYANSNLIGKVGNLVKVVNPIGANPSLANNAGVDLPSALTDVPTDLLLDDGAATNATTNQGAQVVCVPLEAVDQFRVYTTSMGNVGDILVLSATYGQLQKASSSAAGTYNRCFEALENYVPGQLVLVRKYPGTYTH